jgi:hypothetical protein
MPTQPLPACCRFDETVIEEPSAIGHVRGGMILSRLLYIRAWHGESALRELVQRFSPSDRAMLDNPGVSGLYPLALLVRLDRAIVRTFGADVPDVLERLGEFSADLSLGSTLDPALGKDVPSWLGATRNLNLRFQDFGEADSTFGNLQSHTHEAVVTLKYSPAPPSPYCASGVGYFRQAVRLCGGENVEVAITSCAQTGTGECRFLVRWNTADNSELRIEN